MTAGTSITLAGINRLKIGSLAQGGKGCLPNTEGDGSHLEAKKKRGGEEIEDLCSKLYEKAFVHLGGVQGRLRENSV